MAQPGIISKIAAIATISSIIELPLQLHQFLKDSAEIQLLHREFKSIDRCLCNLGHYHN